MKKYGAKLGIIAVLCVGCSQGSSQWYEHANPETSFEIDPLNKKFSFYSNDGRALSADRLALKKTSGDAAETSFEAVNLDITERSVENRGANVAQIEASGKAVAAVATANWTGFAEAITAVAPIAGPYLQGLAQAKLAKAQRPGLIEQLSGLVMAGEVSGQSLKELDASPDIIAEVNRRVAARLAELQAAPPATVPSSPPTPPGPDAGPPGGHSEEPPGDAVGVMVPHNPRLPWNPTITRHRGVCAAASSDHTTIWIGSDADSSDMTL